MKKKAVIFIVCALMIVGIYFYLKPSQSYSISKQYIEEIMIPEIKEGKYGYKVKRTYHIASWADRTYEYCLYSNGEFSYQQYGSKENYTINVINEKLYICIQRNQVDSLYVCNLTDNLLAQFSSMQDAYQPYLIYQLLADSSIKDGGSTKQDSLTIQKITYDHGQNFSTVHLNQNNEIMDMDTTLYYSKDANAYQINIFYDDREEIDNYHHSWDYYLPEEVEEERMLSIIQECNLGTVFPFVDE